MFPHRLVLVSYHLMYVPGAGLSSPPVFLVPLACGCSPMLWPLTGQDILNVFGFLPRVVWSQDQYSAKRSMAAHRLYLIDDSDLENRDDRWVFKCTMRYRLASSPPPWQRQATTAVLIFVTKLIHLTVRQPPCQLANAVSGMK